MIQAMDLPERDWKHLRSVHKAALDRYCAQVLQESSAVVQDGAGSPHDGYLRLYRLLQERDAALAVAFNDLRRTTAIPRLASMLQLEVVTDEELSAFTPETQSSARFLSERSRRRRKKRGTS
jgi:hypothetical protein